MAPKGSFDLDAKLDLAWSQPRSTAARLLGEAERVFAESGFEGARTREIAAAAQVNIASLHFHWKDKSTLYEAVLRNFQRRSALFQDQFSKDMASRDAVPHERLQDWFGLGFATTQGRPWMSRIELRRFASSRPVAEFDDLPLWLARFRLGEEMLTANTSPDARAQLDVRLTSTALMYLFRMFLSDSDIQQELLGGSLYRDRDVQERVLRFLSFAVRRLLLVHAKDPASGDA